jgi:MoaA/NifB/PqqE/SkfB family radical SAM enzyme
MSGYTRRVSKLTRPLAPRLSRMDMELTERCNNRCVHCYINQPENDEHVKAREMDTAFIQDILMQAAGLGCLQVRFTGGEPLLREDFSHIYLFARKLGLKVIIFTNARLITPDLVRLLTRVPPGNPLGVSVYGMQASSYDGVVGVSGAFDEFWQGISLLRGHHIPFVVKQSLLPQNRAEMSMFEAFAAGLPDMKRGPDYTMNFDLRARRDDQAKNRLIKQLRFSPEETLAMMTREPDKYVQEMKQFAAKFMGPAGNKLFTCGAGQSICVDAYGRAQMCMLLRHPDTVYPLDQEPHRQKHPETDLLPLEYALTRFFPRVRESSVAGNPEYLKRCAVCFLKGLCDQCPAKSWEEHGTLDTPVEYLCRVAHAQAVFLGLLLANEKSWEVKPDEWQVRLKNFTRS